MGIKLQRRIEELRVQKEVRSFSKQVELEAVSK